MYYNLQACVGFVMESYEKWISFPHDSRLPVYLSVCPHEFYRCAISGFRRRVSEICAVLGFDAALNCCVLRTFHEILSVPSARVKQSRNVGKKPPLYAKSNPTSAHVLNRTDVCGRISILLRFEQQKTLSMKTFIPFGSKCSNTTCAQNSKHILCSAHLLHKF